MEIEDLKLQKEEVESVKWMKIEDVLAAVKAHDPGYCLFEDEIEMLCVINQRRTLTATADDAVSLMYEIETAARMKHTGIVNNTNLGCETTLDIIDSSRSFADEVCRRTGLPLVYTVYPESCADLTNAPDAFEAKIYVKPIWEI